MEDLSGKFLDLQARLKELEEGLDEMAEEIETSFLKLEDKMSWLYVQILNLKL